MKKAIIAVLFLVTLGLSTAQAATNQSVKGTYAFTSNGQALVNGQLYLDFNAGTIQLNGNGTGKFLTDSDSDGGPVTAGVAITYTVSGNVINMEFGARHITIHGYLGDYNTGGIAQTIVFFATDSAQLFLNGTAVLQ